MKYSRKAVADFIEKKFGHEAACGFLDWSGKGDWDDNIKQYMSDYKAFKASGKTVKDLSKEDVCNYVRKVAGNGAARYVEKYLTKENLKELPRMGKEAFGKHGKFIKKYMGSVQGA